MSQSRLRLEDDGRLVFDGPRYRLEVAANGRRMDLASNAGDALARLRPLAAVDRTDAPDETLAIDAPVVLDDRTFEVRRRSAIWDDARCTITCGDDALDVRTTVRGAGSLAAVRLLAVRSLIRGAPLGLLPSGTPLRTLFASGPSEPPRLVRPAAETAYAGVTGDGEPGRGRWLFTPPPLYFALTGGDDVADVAQPLSGGWLGIAVAAPVEELTFVEAAWDAADGGFTLLVDYDGHTRVDGAFAAPVVVLTPATPDPYTGIRAHRDDLAKRGFAPPPASRVEPAWWSEPIFCGWGAQCYLARGTARRAADFATQQNYDRFVGELESEGLVPGIVVIDDKWQAEYGTNAPDAAKWPDLKRWIAARHERGQHVLLWWKAWDPEGLSPDVCVRTADGAPVALDPGNPRARDELRGAISQMLGPDGLDADGLKIDFTARTPSGRALAAHGTAWGIALLHELLTVVYAAAKDAKRDALVMTHTPHPSFVDVTDMIRLNDMLGSGEGGLGVVPQMAYRAAVARAACPELLIDTDDWPVPDLETWRAYAEKKVEIGVPSLYYSSHLDATGDSLTRDDYDLLRRTWTRWREER